MNTISARKSDGFKVEVFDWNGKTVHSATYQDRSDAVAAAEHWERLVTLNLVDGNGPHLMIDDIMSDDELLRELLG